MKAIVSTPKPVGFTPVSITLTFESQKELDAFGVVHNFTAIHDSFTILAGKKVDYTIRDVIAATVTDAGGNIHAGINEFGRLLRGHGSMQR